MSHPRDWKKYDRVMFDHAKIIAAELNPQPGDVNSTLLLIFEHGGNITLKGKDAADYWAELQARSNEPLPNLPKRTSSTTSGY